MRGLSCGKCQRDRRHGDWRARRKDDPEMTARDVNMIGVLAVALHWQGATRNRTVCDGSHRRWR